MANISEMMKISEVSVLNNVSRMTCYRAITNKQFFELYPGDRKRMSGAGLKRSYPQVCEFELYNLIIILYVFVCKWEKIILTLN